MMFCRCSLKLVRTAALCAPIVILLVPTRALAMELKIVGNQIILSGPVVAGVGDAEPIAAFVLLVRGAPFLSPFRRLPVG